MGQACSTQPHHQRDNSESRSITTGSFMAAHAMANQHIPIIEQSNESDS
jgi:hypothetical protein